MPLALILFLACAGEPAPDSGAVQPLDLPEDPATPGVPVGARTVEHQGVRLEVWYPADDAVAGQSGEVLDLDPFLPASVAEHIGLPGLPGLPTRAVRDAPLRPLDQALPVVLFSHGFGGFRVQSVDLTTHLASRGYLVVAPDHPGRMLGDALPCLFTPPLEGCDLSGFTSDPGPAGLAAALDWVRSEAQAGGWLEGAVDPTRLGVVGHSAGAISTTTYGQQEPEVDALVPMAGGDAVMDLPTAFLAGSCDPFPGMPAVQASVAASSDASLVTLVGSGHLAFTDLCTLDLAGLAAEYLEGRDDLNQALYEGLLQLATSGCPGAAPDPDLGEECTTYLPLQDSAPIVRHYATVHLDAVLSGQGAGVQGGVYDAAQVQ